MAPDERARLLREAPPRSWIAFSGDESSVVAVAATYEEVVTRAEEKGEHDPVLIMTPESWTSRVL
jgi:hypothetical protein